MNVRQLQPPKNESWEHFLLKNVAVALLRLHFGCTIAAMEVAGLGNYENRHKAREGFKHIADAVGIKECKRWVPPKGERAKGYYKTWFRVYGVEVKVSRSDFAAGYCTGGDLNYVMVPKGLVTPGELVPGVGLIEVNLDELTFTRNWGLRGIEITKPARRTERLADAPDLRQSWLDWVFQSMATRLTLTNIKQSPWFYPGWEGAGARLASQG